MGIFDVMPSDRPDGPLSPSVSFRSSVRSRRTCAAVVAFVAVLAAVGWLEDPVLAQDPATVDTDGDGLSDATEETIGTDRLAADTDGDGLLDGWEVNGYSLGEQVEPLFAYAAWPLRKDVFVEIDWMEGADGSAEETAANALIVYQAAVDVTRTFQRSGTEIRIHFDLGDILSFIPPEAIEDDVPLGQLGESNSERVIPYQTHFSVRPAGESSYRSLYELYNDSRFFRPSRRNIFYYMVFAAQRGPSVDTIDHDVPEDENGRVDAFSDAAAQRAGLRPAGVHAGVFFRHPSPPGDDVRRRRYYYSVTLLHELGHAFGLGHGGADEHGRDDANFKLNYPSIMNYRYQYWGVDLSGKGAPTMDFSHGTLRPLSELNVFEPDGLGSRVNMHVLDNLAVEHIPGTPYPYNIDWNDDGAVNSEVLRQDLNENGVLDSEVAVDHDDWGKFQADGFDGIGSNAFDGCGLACGRGDEIRRQTGDFNGDGRTDWLYAFDERVAIATASPNAYHIGASFHYEILGLEMTPTQEFLVGDFADQGRDTILWRRHQSVFLIDYDGGRPKIIGRSIEKLSPRDEATHATAWVMDRRDVLLAAQLQSTATQLVCTSGRDLAIATLRQTGEASEPQFVVDWRGGAALNALTGGAAFEVQAGRRLAGGKQSLFLHSPSMLIEVTPSGDSYVVERLDGDRRFSNVNVDGVPWVRQGDDVIRSVEVDGDAVDEILLRRDDLLGLVVWGDFGPRLAWSSTEIDNLKVRGAEIYTGQFVPGDGEEVLVAHPEEWVMLAWQPVRQTFNVVKRNEPVLFPLQGSPVRIVDGDLVVPGNFEPGTGLDLLVRHESNLHVVAFLAPLRSFRVMRSFSGSVGQWTLDARDELMPVENDLDPMDELVVRRGYLQGKIDFGGFSDNRLSRFLVRFSSTTFAYEEVNGFFLRGDTNGDRTVDLSDSILTLNHLFVDGSELRCEDAADADDNGTLEVSDPVSVLSFLFLRGPHPPPPGPDEPGIDPTADELECRQGV